MAEAGSTVANSTKAKANGSNDVHKYSSIHKNSMKAGR